MLEAQHRSLLALLGVLLVHSVARVRGHCWDRSWCQDMDTEAEVMECLRACRLVLSAESPVHAGHGQPLSEGLRRFATSHFRWNLLGRGGNGSDGLARDSAAALLPASSEARAGGEGGAGGDAEAAERQEGKRSYAMEHFRWGKPVGRKRRPVKVYPTEMEEESSESDPQEFRRDLSWEADYPGLGSPAEKRPADAAPPGDGEPPEGATKDSAAYQMRHFRWSAPAAPKKKRYGGFMASERGHAPLVTLFRNAIVKSAHGKGP